MTYYAGLDVSLEETAVVVVDECGAVVRDVTVASDPGALIAYFGGCGLTFERIGLEAGPCRSGYARDCGLLDFWLFVLRRAR